MMISDLTENIILLTDSPVDLTKNRFEKFQKILKTRAKIVPLTKGELEIVIGLPPSKFSKFVFTGVLWEDREYSCSSPFTEHKGKFLKGKFILN